MITRAFHRFKDCFRKVDACDKFVDNTFAMFTKWKKTSRNELFGEDETAEWIGVTRKDLLSIINELNEALIESHVITADDYDNAMTTYNKAVAEINKGDTNALNWIVKNRSSF